MPKVHVEARPKGKPEGSAITDYVVDDLANHVLSDHRTHKGAIGWAKGPAIIRWWPARGA